MKALRVELTDTLAYWTVVDDNWVPVALADAYLRHLRLGADRAEGTTRTYAGDLACYLGWCEASGRDLLAGATALGMFVVMLKTTPVAGPAPGRAGSAAPAGSTTCSPRCASSTSMRWLTARWRPRCWRCCSRWAMTGTCLPSCVPRVPGFAIWPGPAMFSGPGEARPVPVRREEAEALVRACRSWRDRFLLVLLWFCGLRVGEALGLRRSDLHLVPAAAALGCSVPGPHLHVVGRDNPNRARAKSGDRAVPVRAEVLSCYDRYLAERDACPAAEGCDFVLVNLGHQPLGQAMSTGTVRKWLAALSARAGLERTVTPHMFRHATATELLARGASIDVVKELLGHASIRSTEVYLHPDADAQRAAVDRLGPLGFGEATP